jgi:OH-DDVA oxygenase
MAQLVFGMGTSHGPLLSTPPEQWDLRASADRVNKQHFFRGKAYDFDSLVAERTPGFAAELAIETRRERFARCQRALHTMAEKFKQVSLDALVIFGNDQREIFNDALTPAITVYRGATIENIPDERPEVSPGLGVAEKGNCPEGGATYPGFPKLADHIVQTLADRSFDVAQCGAIPKTAARLGIPHAYGFVYHRVMADTPPPSVPVIFNVHYPHNRPRVGRCLELGRALRDAIHSFEGNQRIGFVASGGLTHFVVDEAIDHRVLEAMAHADESALASLPESYFQSGTAEIKNWLPVIAAMNAEGRSFHLVDYVPCYRSEAGTGNAMAFVYWE